MATSSIPTPLVDTFVADMENKIREKLFDLCTKTVEYMKREEDSIKNSSISEIVEAVMGTNPPKKSGKSADWIEIEGIKIPLTDKVKIPKQKTTQVKFDACYDNRKNKLCSNLFSSGANAGYLCLAHPTVDNRCSACAGKKSKEDNNTELKNEAARIGGREGINTFYKTPEAKIKMKKTNGNKIMISVNEEIKGALIFWDEEKKSDTCVGYIKDTIEDEHLIDLKKYSISKPPGRIIDNFDKFGIIMGELYTADIVKKTRFDLPDEKYSGLDFNINSDTDDEKEKIETPTKEKLLSFDSDSDDFGNIE